MGPPVNVTVRDLSEATEILAANPIGAVVGAVISGGAGALTGVTFRPQEVSLAAPPSSKSD